MEIVLPPMKVTLSGFGKVVNPDGSEQDITFSAERIQEIKEKPSGDNTISGSNDSGS